MTSSHFITRKRNSSDLALQADLPGQLVNRTSELKLITNSLGGQEIIIARA
jgi:hypothetical protein